MENRDIHILYVDDEEHNLLSFKATFRIRYTVHTALSASEAKKILEKVPIHIIITDQRMPGMTGVEFLESVLPLYPDPIRILLTAYTDVQAVVDSINKGKIFHFLTKPWKERELDDIIQQAYQAYKKQLEEKELVKKLGTTNEQLEFLLRQQMLS